MTHSRQRIASSLPRINAQTPSTAHDHSDESGVSRSQSGCEVQWAVKVHDPDARTASHASAASRPKTASSDANGLDAFSSLLRDRYEGKRSLRVAFLNWDRDKDGRLSGSEVREMIATLGFASRLGPGKVERVIEHISTLPASYVDMLCPSRLRLLRSRAHIPVCLNVVGAFGTKTSVHSSTVAPMQAVAVVVPGQRPSRREQHDQRLRQQRQTRHSRRRATKRSILTLSTS